MSTRGPSALTFGTRWARSDIERRDSGNALAQIDPSLSCAKFRDKDWLVSNRPEWPPQLVENVRSTPRRCRSSPSSCPARVALPHGARSSFEPHELAILASGHECTNVRLTVFRSVALTTEWCESSLSILNGENELVRHREIAEYSDP